MPTYTTQTNCLYNQNKTNNYPCLGVVVFYFPGTANTMFFPAYAMKMLRHSTVSHWEWVMVASFPKKYNKKQKGMRYFFG